uniref:Uncharacterized protein n=1 Tax=Rhizophora mucronata TaxID=61149 RepID=A0A2P2NQA4_RHIMU
MVHQSTRQCGGRPRNVSMLSQMRATRAKVCSGIETRYDDGKGKQMWFWGSLGFPVRNVGFPFLVILGCQTECNSI